MLWGNSCLTQNISDKNNHRQISDGIADTAYIDPLSIISIYLETEKNINGKNTKITRATGFILKEKSKHYLITNWHVVTNRSRIDSSAKIITIKNEIGNDVKINIADPEKLITHFHGIKLGTWHPITIDLYENGKKKWIEHPLGSKVDVIAIPLNLTKHQQDSVQLYAIEYEKYNDDIILYPSINLSIIGFPRGLASYGKFPIWKTGQLATDYDINVDNLPVFLIDASTRGGMSGSPVIIRQAGTTLTKGSFSIGGKAQKFLGVYSGRVPGDLDIGIVWKVDCLKEILK